MPWPIVWFGLRFVLGCSRASTAWMRSTRILPTGPIQTLASYEQAGGGRGLAAAGRLRPDDMVEHLVAAGLRGRGGAGFPTSRKWAAVREHAAGQRPPTVVVNAAEGEPGSFKDRVLLRRNAYAVLEGALVAAAAVDAERVIVALKAEFTSEIRTVRRVMSEFRVAGWTRGVDMMVFEGPGEYLYGEETALLEAIDGRPPFPRLAPPYRHGVEEMRDDEGGEPAAVVMADTGHQTGAPPTLVNNVETMANVAGIMANGPAWFRELGTDESPGTIICTVTGATRHAGIGEVPMGTPLRQAIDELGGGARSGHRIVGAMSGVANPVVPGELLDTPLSYEAMQAIGTGLGAAGFIVFDDTTDFAAVAHGVSKFLAVESCGQCIPCKEDGLALSELLDRIRASEAHELDLLAIDDHLRTITDGARCFLAHQHQRVIGSIMTHFAGQLRAHVEGRVEPVETELIAPISDLVDDVVVLEESQRDKQPDWTFDPIDSGKTPVERLAVPPDTGEPVVAPIAAPEPAAATTKELPEPHPSPPTSTEPVHRVHGVPPESLDPDDVEAPLYTSEPVETEEGTVVIQQQAGGKDNVEGGGEWPDPDTPPQRPAPGAR
jgi:NADH-quinone oxidoreductase subunit F